MSNKVSRWLTAGIVAAAKLVPVLAVAPWLTGAPHALAATETTLFIFPSNRSKGCYPDGTLLRDAAGALYGTTRGCPISQNDTVFKLTPPLPGQTNWTASVLHTFDVGLDGRGPQSNLVMDANGALYGTTSDYGEFLEGMVYQLKPPQPGQTKWTETILHAFDYNYAYRIPDGSAPDAGLIMDGNGALYGTTVYGGSLADPTAVGYGTVFRLMPPAPGATKWTETVLYRFKGGFDGENPRATLTMDAAGALYGTTLRGGTQTCGTVIGCGTVFKLTPPAPGQTRWTKATLHRFTNGADGGLPEGKLLLDGSGALYGAASQGGKYPCTNSFGTIGCGIVFKLIPPAPGGTRWTEVVLHDFQGMPDGASPQGGVIMDTAGNLYGTTISGGTSCPDLTHGGSVCGTVFKLSPPIPGKTAWTETVLYNFKDENDGWKPVGELVRDLNGNLIGVTSLGTPSNFGAVFEITP
jgi:uncharacterized repeat protein (TIGR03803 family)